MAIEPFLTMNTYGLVIKPKILNSTLLYNQLVRFQKILMSCLLSTHLDREPRIAGRHIDLFRLYTRVCEEGGYDAMSDTKAKPLAWRRISGEFLPAGPHLQYQAFMVKTIYYKNLACVHVLHESSDGVSESLDLFKILIHGLATVLMRLKTFIIESPRQRKYWKRYRLRVVAFSSEQSQISIDRRLLEKSSVWGTKVKTMLITLEVIVMVRKRIVSERQKRRRWISMMLQAVVEAGGIHAVCYVFKKPLSASCFASVSCMLIPA